MPAVNETYVLGFVGDKGTDWRINISDIAPTTTPIDFGEGTRDLTSNNFKLKYKGENNDPFDPLKSSSLRFPIVVRNATDESVIEDIFHLNFDVNWYVSLYRKLVGGTYKLHWWGYLNPITAQRPNEYFPFYHNIEAVDVLANLKDQKIFAKNNTSWVHIPILGAVVWTPKHRFGEDRSQNITVSNLLHIYPKKKPTIVEIVYSLLYDLDTSVIGELHALAYWVPGQTGSPINTGPFNHATVNIWWELFKDMPANPKLLGYPIEKDQSITSGGVLRRICELFCLRIFQKDGDYYLVQPEVYQTAGNVTLYSYAKGPIAGAGNHPIFNGSSTLTTADYLTTVASPPIRPKILDGSLWSKLYGINQVSLEGSFSNGAKAWKITRSISGSTNNLSDLSVKESSKEAKIPMDKIFFRGKPTGRSTTLQDWFRGTSQSSFDTYVTNVRARMEVRNNIRYIFEGAFDFVTGASSSWDFLKGLSYNGRYYLPHSITLSGEEELYKAKFIEMRIEDGDLGEPIGEEINPE